MKKLLNYIKNHKKLIAITSIVLLLVFVVRKVSADTFGMSPSDFGDMIIGIISDLTGVIVNLLGKLIGFWMNYLVLVAQYDGFATAPAIEKGWIIMRDLGNLCIVIALLVVAFMTALNIGHESQVGKSLSTLVMVAIVLNFSKTISLLMVDVSQVVMMTFVNAFKDIGTGNLATILGIEKFFDVSQNNPGVTVASALAAMLFTVIVMIIVLAVMVVMTLTMVSRLIHIWFYIVLSPIAFATIAIPGQKKNFDRWMKEFTEYLMVGPLLAFFIWLTFVSMQNATDFRGNMMSEKQRTDLQAGAGAVEQLGAIGQADQLVGFVLAIGMLLLGLKFTGEMSGGAGKMAGSLATKAESTLRAAGAGAARLVTAPVVDRAKAAGAGIKQGMAERMYERGGLAKMMTARGKKEQLERITAGAQKGFGGKASARASQMVLQDQAKARDKDMERMGVLDNRDSLDKFIAEKAKKGDAASVFAAEKAAGEKGWGSEERYLQNKDLIKTNFGTGPGADKMQLKYEQDLIKANAKHGKLITGITDKVENEDTGVIEFDQSTPEARMEKVISRMDKEGMKKMLDRTDALDDPYAEAKVKAASKNPSVIAELTDGNRKRMNDSLNAKIAQPEYWNSLSIDQKREHSELLEMTGEGAKYEDNRRVEEEVWVNEKKWNKNKKGGAGFDNIPTLKKQRTNGMSAAAIDDPAIKAEWDKMNNESLKGEERADARDAYNDKVKAWKKDPYKGGAPVPRNSAVTESTQRGMSETVSGTWLSSIGKMIGQGPGLVGQVAMAVATSPVDLMEKIADGVSAGVGRVVQASGNVLHDATMSDDQDAINDEARQAQKQLDVATNTGNYSGVNSQLDQMARQVVLAFGDKKKDPSGDIDKATKNSISNEVAVGKVFGEAKNAVDAAVAAATASAAAAAAAAADPSSKAKAATADKAKDSANKAKDKANQLTQNAVLRYSPSAHTQIMSTNNLQMQKGGEIAAVQSMSKNLGKAEGNNNEKAINGLISTSFDHLEDVILPALKDARANPGALAAEKQAISQLREKVAGLKVPSDRTKELKTYMDQMEQRLKTGAFFKLKT